MNDDKFVKDELNDDFDNFDDDADDSDFDDDEVEDFLKMNGYKEALRLEIKNLKKRLSNVDEIFKKFTIFKEYTKEDYKRALDDIFFELMEKADEYK
jgi:hypothetical protein